MDAQKTVISALTELSRYWSAAQTMLDLLEGTNFRPDLCQAVNQLLAEACGHAKISSAVCAFKSAETALAKIRVTEEIHKAQESKPDFSLLP